MRLWELLKDFTREKRQFSQQQVINGWLNLADNTIVMQQLYEWQRFDQDAIRQLLLLDKDRRDIEKAKIYGRLQVVGGILEQISLAQKAQETINSNLWKKHSTRPWH